MCLIVKSNCRIGKKSEWFILRNFSEWVQFGTMKVRYVIPVIRMLTFNISSSE